jgi:hypothetical protein
MLGNKPLYCAGLPPQINLEPNEVCLYACMFAPRHLSRREVATWSDIPELPKAAVELLERGFSTSTSRVLHASTSADGETTKLLVELQDGLQVEAVVMHYDTTGARESLCCAAVIFHAPQNDWVPGAVGESVRPTLVSWSYFACRIGRWVPMWQQQ